MNNERTKMVKLLNWVKKTYNLHIKDTSTVVVEKYLNSPQDEQEDSQPLSQFYIDGDGDAFDDFGTGLGGQPLKPEERRYCKGCHADVTKSMYCHCGDFGLKLSETLSETELNNMQ